MLLNEGYGPAYAAGSGGDPALGTEKNNIAHALAPSHSLPQLPGEDALKHITDKWTETASARLATIGLLSVALGGAPLPLAAAAALSDALRRSVSLQQACKVPTQPGCVGILSLAQGRNLGENLRRNVLGP